MKSEQRFETVQTQTTNPLTQHWLQFGFSQFSSILTFLQLSTVIQTIHLF